MLVSFPTSSSTVKCTSYRRHGCTPHVQGSGEPLCRWYRSGHGQGCPQTAPLHSHRSDKHNQPKQSRFWRVSLSFLKSWEMYLWVGVFGYTGLAQSWAKPHCQYLFTTEKHILLSRLRCQHATDTKVKLWERVCTWAFPFQWWTSTLNIEISRYQWLHIIHTLMKHNKMITNTFNHFLTDHHIINISVDISCFGCWQM